MAIETVNARYEGFIFDGENSRDYGVYVQDVEVFGAPTRDVEMISIPGRDGEYAMDNGRFNNIQIKYVCALGADSQSDFNTAISDLRNWLAAKKGYKRLEDEINTGEYRMAVFKDGLDVSTLNKETGTFEVAFDCKPQRFLKSGEEPTEIGGEPKNPRTYSGAVATFEGTETDVISSLKVAITPKQSGSGDPSPSNVRPITGWTTVNVIVSPTTTASDGTTTPVPLGQTVYGGTLDVGTGVLTIDSGYLSFNGSENWSLWANVNAYYINTGISGYRPSFMKCNEFKWIGVLNFAGMQVGEFLANSQDTVTWNGNISFKFDDGSDLAGFKTWLASHPLQVVYELETPTTVQLTPTQVASLLGTNNVWSDAGEVTVTVADNPNMIVNPTLFESHPLLQVWGFGDISINGEAISIDDTVIGEVTLVSSVSGGTTSFPTSQLNRGDNVTLNTPPLYEAYANVQFLIKFEQIVDSVSVSVEYGETHVSRVYAYGGDNTTFAYIILWLEPFEIDYLTTTRATENIRLSLTVNYTDGNGVQQADIEYYTMSLTYADAQFTLAANIETMTDLVYSVSKNLRMGAITAYSTKSALGEPLYFDLDIGEAYKYEDGAVVSVNNAVSFPVSLPVLAPGANTIDYDNTVTQFEVVPRWWKV